MTTTETPVTLGSDVVADDEVVGYVRSASDVLRLVAFGSLSLVLLALVRSTWQGRLWRPPPRHPAVSGRWRRP